MQASLFRLWLNTCLLRLARSGTAAVWAVSWTAASAPAASAEPVWNAFAGSDTVQVCGLPERVKEGTPVWFRVAKGHRTIATGTARAGSGGRVKLPAPLPDMKAGVALPLEAELREGSEEGGSLRAGTLWAFSEQPFAAGPPRMRRPLILYDPEGKTEEAFRSIGLSCETIPRAALLDEPAQAVVVIGEGVSLKGERGLFERLAAAVARGSRVLLLAPADGQLTPPAAWRTLRAGCAEDVLREPAPAAYKLDLGGWPPEGRAAHKRFHLEASRGEAVFAVTGEAGCEAVGWDDGVSGGRFRACGLEVVKNWQEAPAARWLLAELVTRLANEE
jgi:hypothetical protein